MDQYLVEPCGGQYRFGMLGEGHDKIVERHLKAHRKSKFLHVGSSSNRIINRNVSSLVDRVICGDLLEPATKLREENISGVVPVAMDVFETPFRDNTFDLILAIGIPPLYERPVQGLMELHRVNSHNGKLIICNRSGWGDYCVNEYGGIAEAIGYHVLEENVAWDDPEMTGAKERYLLVLQK